MRRNSFKLFVIFGLILFLAVGYAVVNSVSLTVSGNANSSTSTLKVAFTGDYEISNPNKGSASVTSNSTDATFEAKNMSLNDTITYTYTIRNSEVDVAADVALTTTGSNNYFSVYLQENTFTLDPGTEKNVTVIVKMIKTPISSSDSSANLSVSINAIPVEFVKMINFSIDGKTYQAEEGMTLEEWVNSPYNTDGFFIRENYVVVPGGESVLEYGYSYHVIEDGKRYLLAPY